MTLNNINNNPANYDFKPRKTNLKQTFSVQSNKSAKHTANISNFENYQIDNPYKNMYTLNSNANIVS